jgi:rootletin
MIYRELNLRSEEEKCSKMREELVTLREDLNRAYLTKDVLEQQKLETDAIISQIEKNKGINNFMFSLLRR